MIRGQKNILREGLVDMRSSFDTYMDVLNTELIKMGALCEEALSCAIKTIFDKDEEIVRKAEALEEEIDAKERDI